MGRDSDAEQKSTDAVRFGISVIGVEDDAVCSASDDFEGNGIIDVLIGRISCICDSDQFSFFIEQPAARISAVKSGIDADRAIGTCGVVDLKGDVFALRADDALRYAESRSLRISDRDRSFSDVIFLSKTDRLCIFVDILDVTCLGAKDCDIIGDCPADIFQRNGVIAVVINGIAV